MRKGILAAFLIVASFVAMSALSTSVIARGIKVTAIEHSLSIVQRPDGNFDVTCLDGVQEVKSRTEVLASAVCAHLRSYNGRWQLIEGGVDNGVRLCDLNMEIIRSVDNIVKLSAGFVAPCSTAMTTSQQCQGLSCSLQLNNRYFNFDFSVAGKATLTRLDDNFRAVYRGSGGSGGGGGGGSSSGMARVTTIDGIANILQASNDNGVTWLSVCDDNFAQREAGVACREMGFSGAVQSLRTAVYVYSDSRYGWDDLTCTGNETSLAQCRHTPWEGDNCDASEHVQLVCAP